MRPIDLSKVKHPDGWHALAKVALEAVEVADDGDRTEIIGTKQRVWSDLKGALEDLSNKKCWYCEAIQVRSDKHVDHFRPKGHVSKEDSEDHGGYWWLAFDSRNLRYSCTYCNCRRIDVENQTTGGKADRFPILDEGKRCRNPTGLIGEEQPYLLDPTVPADPALLWFDEDGCAKPVTPDCHAWPHLRATKSIEIYHLNHTDIKEKRQGVANHCKRLVDEAEEKWPAYC